MKYLPYLGLLLILPFCKRGQEGDERWLAKVGDRVLKLGEVRPLIKPGTSPEDSITFVNAYRDKWIKTQLLLQRAELNLPGEMQDVSRQLEEYKNSLLIFIYEQKLIREKLDTNVSASEIQEYYEKNLSELLLGKEIVKALYIKVPLNAPDMDLIRKLYKSDKPDDIKMMETYCFHNAAEYSYFDDDWVYFDEILEKIPLKIENKPWFLKNNAFIEVKDSAFQYFVYIKEYRLRGDHPPLFMIEDNIKNIILNKRKIEFLSELENEIYVDALKHNQFTVY